MKRGKLIAYCVLICLPAVLLVGAGLYLALTEVPRLVRSEPRRVTRLYREEAETLKAKADSIPPTRVRPPDPPNGKIDGWPWGYWVRGEKATVWVQSLAVTGEKEWRFAPAPFYAPFPYGAVCYGGGGLVALTLIGLTVLAVLYFVRFLKERDDFLAATAHDLTTPLVGLRRMIGRNDDEARTLNERMIRLVTNIKDFLRLGGRPKPKTERFDLVKAFNEAYALFAADYRDLFDGDDIQVDRTELTSAEVCADETLTIQILWNLLGNDLKYAAPHGRVSVRFSSAGRFVRTDFIDEGPGMTPHERRHAFDRYYRAKTVLESGKGGFGIGLCTAREFAEAMGGSLSVRANSPQGCVFTLELPRMATSLPE